VTISYAVKAPKALVDRRYLHEVLGIESAGSKHGSTRWKRMRKCAREEQLYTLGVRKKAIAVEDRDSLDFGTLFHMGLEVYYKAMRAGKTMREGIDACWYALDVIAEEPGYEELFADLDRSITSYFEFAENDNWEILCVEDTFSRQLVYTLEVRGVKHKIVEPYSARLDLVIRDRATTGVRIVEHKTTKRMTDDYLVGYEADIQTLGQCWLLEPSLPLLGRWDGISVNITTRPSARKPPTHHRSNILFSPYHIAEFEKSMAAEAMLNELRRDLHYPKSLGNCNGAVNWFKQCSYFDLCHRAASFNILPNMVDDDLPYGYTMRADIPLEE
jgi:hypothetical protein